MAFLESTTNDALKNLDTLAADPNVDGDQFLVQLVRAGAAILELFLRIHPYANGNGHLGRCIVKALGGRYGTNFSGIEINQQPPYAIALSKYRDAEPRPLINFLIKAVNASPAP